MCFCVVVFQSLSCVWFFATPSTAACQAPLSFTLFWNLLTCVHWLSDAISILSSFSFCLHSFPASGSFWMSPFFSSETTVLELQLQHQSFQWIVKVEISFRIDWSDFYNSRDSQESSPTPQFKSINSSALSFLYGPTLTHIHTWLSSTTWYW